MAVRVLAELSSWYSITVTEVKVKVSLLTPRSKRDLVSEKSLKTA